MNPYEIDTDLSEKSGTHLEKNELKTGIQLVCSVVMSIELIRIYLKKQS